MLASNSDARGNVRSRRVALIAAVVGLMALLAWFLFVDTRVTSVAPNATTDSEVSATQEPELAASIAAAEAASRASVAAAEVESAVAPTTTVDTAGDEELRGRVIDPEQRPIPGALVSLHRGELRTFSVLDVELSRTTERFAETVTDGAGEFRFELARGVPVDVHVEAADFCPAQIPDRHAGEFVVVPLSAGFRVFGRVTRKSDRAPVADAQVRGFMLDGPLSLSRTTVTASNGGYELLLAHSERIALEVIPLVEQSPPWMQVTLGPDGQAEHDVVVEDGLVATGRVTSAVDGTAISGATVGEGWTFQRAATTDADGVYRMSGCRDAGTNELFAKARGFGQTKCHDVPGAVDGVLHVDFQLAPARRAHGRVVAPDGSPLESAVVSAVASHRDAQGRRSEWLTSRTDAFGRFEFESLTIDMRHALMLSKHGHATRVYDFPAEELTNADLDLGEFVLGPPALLAGVVEDELGNGLAGFTIQVFGTNSDRGRLLGGTAGERDVTAGMFTDSRSSPRTVDGRFSFGDLAAGSYTVVACMHGRPDSSPVHVTLVEGEQRDDLRIVVPTGSRLTGRVLDPEGLPVADVFVRAELVELRGAAHASNHSQSKAFTGSDGRFEFGGLDAGDYRLHVRTGFLFDNSAHAPLLDIELARVPTDADELEIVLTRGATIRGTLRDAAGNELTGYSIYDRSSGTNGASTVTDAHGAFRLTLPTGRTCDIGVAVIDSGVPEELLVVHSVVAGTDGLELRLP